MQEFFISQEVLILSLPEKVFSSIVVVLKVAIQEIHFQGEMRIRWIELGEEPTIM